MPDKSCSCFSLQYQINPNQLPLKMNASNHDTSKSNLRSGPHTSDVNSNDFPPCFLDMHHLACWTCLVINYHPRPLIPCPMLTSALSYFMPLDLGYLRSQGGEQTMQTHTGPHIAPSAVRQHLHRTCKPKQNRLLWEFKSRLHFKNCNGINGMEKRSVQ